MRYKVCQLGSVILCLNSSRESPARQLCCATSSPVIRTIRYAQSLSFSCVSLRSGTCWLRPIRRKRRASLSSQKRYVHDQYTSRRLVRALLTVVKEVDELVADWTPEPLVAPQTSFEEAENEKRPVIVG